MTDDLFQGQLPRCPLCERPIGDKHDARECAEWALFRKKARASFEALEWGTGEISDAGS